MTSVSERRIKAFEYAAESIKQLIAIATGLIAFTVTFSKDFVSAVGGPLKWVAAIGWLFLLGSVCFGLLALQALAGQMDQTAENATPDGDETAWAAPSIWSSAVGLLWKLQQGSFALGLLTTIIFGGISIAKHGFAPVEKAGLVSFTPPADTQAASVVASRPPGTTAQAHDSLVGRFAGCYRFTLVGGSVYRIELLRSAMGAAREARAMVKGPPIPTAGNRWRWVPIDARHFVVSWGGIDGAMELAVERGGRGYLAMTTFWSSNQGTTDHSAARVEKIDCRSRPS